MLYFVSQEKYRNYFLYLSYRKKVSVVFQLKKVSAGNIQVHLVASVNKQIKNWFGEVKPAVALRVEENFKQLHRTLYVRQVIWIRADWKLKMAMDCWTEPSSKSFLLLDDEHSIAVTPAKVLSTLAWSVLENNWVCAALITLHTNSLIRWMKAINNVIDKH